MKILKIHIERFGTLADMDLEFSSGVNRICRDNGWGKTTLSVFIRVMFYGFPSKGERAKDRDRYNPWEPGNYGGSLTFSSEGRSYTIYRFFGRSKSGGDDSFHLIDEKTGKESSRWTGAIGTELFGMNEESFVNTAWIRQDTCSITGDITAKLGGESDVLEDLKRFDQIMSRTEKHLNRLSPLRKTGQIYRKQMEKQELEMEVLRIPSVETSISRLEQQIEAEKSQKAVLMNGQTASRKLQQEYSEREDYLSLKKVYDRLQKEYFLRDEIWEKQQEKFPEGLPDEKKSSAASEKDPGEIRRESEEKTVWGIKNAGGAACLACGILLLAAAFPFAFLLKPVSAVSFLAGLMLSGIGIRSTLAEENRRQQEPDQFQQLLKRQSEEEAARAAWRELQRADRELRLFFEANPRFEAMAEEYAGSGLPDVQSLRELNERIRIADDEIRSRENHIRELTQKQELLMDERERLAELQDKLSVIEEDLAALQKEYWVTETAARYLKEARDISSSRYMDTLQQSFQQYYEVIDPLRKVPLSLDADCRIRTLGGGLPRSEEVLSRGYRNLAALCLRFALLDAMYEQEPPCVILDDPFLNFDDSKAERAEKLLEKVSEKYQILYLSCRSPSGSGT